jgi:hypothetical protein
MHKFAHPNNQSMLSGISKILKSAGYLLTNNKS